MTELNPVVWKATMRAAETSAPIPIDPARSSLIGKFPIAVVVSLLLQASLFIWWAAAMSARFDERLNQLQERSQRLEVSVQRSNESLANLIDRLARVEEKLAMHSERMRRGEALR